MTNHMAVFTVDTGGGGGMMEAMEQWRSRVEQEAHGVTHATNLRGMLADVHELSTNHGVYDPEESARNRS